MHLECEWTRETGKQNILTGGHDGEKREDSGV